MSAPTPMAPKSCIAASEPRWPALWISAAATDSGIGQRAVLDHDAAQEGDEEDAQDAAHDHEGARGEVLRGVEGLEAPDLEDDEGRDREDRARRHRLADRADRSRVVLLEERALHHPQHRHADDRGRVGGRDRHAGAQAEVGVGGAEHDAHHQAQEEGPDRELRHRGVVGDVGLVVLVAHEASHSGRERAGGAEKWPDVARIVPQAGEARRGAGGYFRSGSSFASTSPWSPGGAPKNDADPAALRVEQEERGHRAHVAEGAGHLRRAHGPAQRRAGLGRHPAHVGLVGLERDGQHHQAVAVTPAQLAEPAQRAAAGRAPGGPELDEDRAPGEVLAGDRPAVEVGEGEGRERGDLGDVLAPRGGRRVVAAGRPGRSSITRARSARKRSWLAALLSGA